MERELLLENFAGQTRLAVIEDGKLCELSYERSDSEKLVGNIYMGRVMNVLPGMQAAFVDIGLEKNGFLYAGDISIDKRSLGTDAGALDEALKNLSIRKLVRPGQTVPVQVIKEPYGVKGPRLTENITLPGRLAVLLPTVGYIGISRRIEDEEERARLRQVAEKCRPQGMGLIVRTAAAGVEEATFARDIEYLLNLWRSIEQMAAHTKAPALLHSEAGLINRSVRDLLLPDVTAFKVQDQASYEAVHHEAELYSRELAERVTLYTGETPLFDLYKVDHQIEQALRRKVWLASGGYLVFDFAEALTVIDVNTGKFVGKKSLSDTIFKINCEAVVEIARQLRLRDIGGIIIIDFIDMEEIEHQEALEKLLRQELKKDRTKTNLVGLTSLGLMEMTRKKVHQPIHTILKETCPACLGSGMTLSAQSIAINALLEARSMGALAHGAWVIEAHPEVAGQLLLIGTEKGAQLYVKSNPKRGRENYDISPIEEGKTSQLRRVPEA